MKKDHILHLEYVKKYLQQEILEYERIMNYFESKDESNRKPYQNYIQKLQTSLEVIEHQIEIIKNPLPF